MIEPPESTSEQLEVSRLASIDGFHRERLEEPLEDYLRAFEEYQATAVLGGVYKLHNLVHAQERGLSLFWAHNLQRMLEWIDETRI